jgi:methanethiol S-methyltransferase
MSKRIIVFIYGLGSYGLFLGTFLYAIGFIGNFVVAKSIDSEATEPWPSALLVNMSLLALFAVQHSVMARPAFKRLITRFIPAELERSTYVLASSAALLLLFWQWRPLGGVVWAVSTEPGRTLLLLGMGFGWLLLLVSTFAINHFDLFGLNQVWHQLLGRPQAKLSFVTPILYRIVRHPLYVGWLCAFWSTPMMTVTHLVFASVTTIYILVAVQLEERDLIREHPEYAAYRKEVPMLIPRWPRKRVQSSLIAERKSS